MDEQNTPNQQDAPRQLEPGKIDWVMVKGWVKQFLLSWTQLVSIPVSAYIIYQWTIQFPEILDNRLRFVGTVLFVWFLFSIIMYYVRYQLKMRQAVKQIMKAREAAAKQQAAMEVETEPPKEDEA